MHDAIPEVASLPAKETAIGFEYQPFASGPRASDAPAAGAVRVVLERKSEGRARVAGGVAAHPGDGRGAAVRAGVGRGIA